MLDLKSQPNEIQKLVITQSQILRVIYLSEQWKVSNDRRNHLLPISTKKYKPELPANVRAKEKINNEYSPYWDIEDTSRAHLSILLSIQQLDLCQYCYRFNNWIKAKTLFWTLSKLTVHRLSCTNCTLRGQYLFRVNVHYT